MIKPAYRLSDTKEYYFSIKLKEVKQLIEEGKPIINLGIGSPDLAPHEDVVQAMKDATKDDKAHQYQPYSGIKALRQAITSYYQDIYDVNLDADDNVLPLLGSKEGILHISMAFVNPGDHILVPNPGYPTYSAVAKLVEAKCDYYDLTPQNNWQPSIDQLEQLVTPKTKLMWINYPHMPTGTQQDEEVLQKLIAFTDKHHILLVNDNPYSLILNDTPRSILKYSWPNGHILELNSLSKSFNLSGWRVGMLCGDKNLIYNVLKVKSNIDSGMFYPIQKGSIKALETAKDWIPYLNTQYAKRRQLMWQLCDKLNLSYDKNTCGLFVWAKINSSLSSVEFSDILLYKYNLFVTPGDIFGSNGKGYLRFSLCLPEDKIIQSIDNIKNFTP